MYYASSILVNSNIMNVSLLHVNEAGIDITE